MKPTTYLTLRDAAALAGCGVQALRLAIQRGELRPYRIPGHGRRFYLDRAQLDLWRLPVTANPPATPAEESQCPSPKTS